MRPRIAALYARVSSERQVTQRTIDSQLEALKARIGADGLALSKEHCYVDDGYSGATFLRPALEKLRDGASMGAFSKLYVLSSDRLARNLSHQLVLLEELKARQVEVVFLDCPQPANELDDLVVKMRGLFAEYERAQILERSRRGHLYAARQGKASVLTQAPYGYRRVKGPGGSEATCFEVDLEQAQIVRRMFAAIGRDRLSLGQLVRELHNSGVRSPTGRCKWDRSTLWSLLQNPAYRGAAAYGKRRRGPRIERPRPMRHKPLQPRNPSSLYRSKPSDWILIPVPAIVSEELFAAVGEQLQENRRRARKQIAGRKNLLQGLTVCAECGCAYCVTASTSGGRGHRYYTCSNKHKRSVEGSDRCANRSVRAEDIEQAIWSDVLELLSEPQRIERELERRHQGQEPGMIEELLKQQQGMLRKLERSTERLLDAYADGLIKKEELAPRLEHMRERTARLEGEKERLEQISDQGRYLRLITTRVEDFARQFRERARTISWAKRHAIIRALVKRIEVHPGTVRVVYRVEPSSPPQPPPPPPERHDPPPAPPQPQSALPRKRGTPHPPGADLQHCWTRPVSSVPWRDSRLRARRREGSSPQVGHGRDGARPSFVRRCRSQRGLGSSGAWALSRTPGTGNS